MSDAGLVPRGRTFCVGILLLADLLTSGCCSIIHQTKQDVAIGSEPTKASVIIDAQRQGETPLVAQLKRKHTHTIRIELEGYQPQELVLTRKVSGWVWGNIVFGGIIGLAVDAINGSMYKLTPKEVQATLAKTEVKVLYQRDGVYIFTTLVPSPEWESIAALTRDMGR